MCNLHILVVFLSIIVYAKCVGELEDGFERKRYDLSLQTCIDSFVIHRDTIIRTQDSRAMGAKYLNEAEVNSREECLKLCCETPTCDVFVHEQKIPGSCYMFHCGTHENLKCQFTHHGNYTSAIRTVNNHLNELENQIKLTKHEEELARLRKPEPPTTAPPTLSTIKVPTVQETKTNHSMRSQCSRYQFECRGSGECIAIYNACDGIPQCSDGSDEAPELDCPTVAGTTRPKPMADLPTDSKMSPNHNTPLHVSIQNPILEQHQTLNKQSEYRPQQASTWQQSPSLGYLPFGQNSQNEKMAEFPSHPKMEPPQQLMNQAKFYGREGEGLAQPYPLANMQWQGYQQQQQQQMQQQPPQQQQQLQHQPEEGSHIFTHKGSGLVPDSSDRYTNRQYLFNRNHHGQIPGPYNNEISHSEYLKYMAAAAGNNNGYYNNGAGPLYYPGPNNWAPRQQHAPGMEEVPQRPGLNMYGVGNTGPGLSDYYYEDSQLKARVPVQQDPRGSENEQASAGQKPAVAAAGSGKDSLKPAPAKSSPSKEEEEKPKKSESVKKTLEGSASTKHKDFESKTKPESSTISSKTDKLGYGVAEQLTVNEVDMIIRDVDGENEKPSGAILSLTLGMCISAVMITLVGCRLRLVRKRMRRGGKSNYAHDPDFLVNGMYL